MHTQTIPIRYICIYIYLSIYGGSQCGTKVRTLKGIRHYCCSVGSLYRVSRSHSVHVTWFTTRGQAVVKHTHHVIAYNSQLVLV